MAKTDIDYVESAYADAIGVLFKQLFNGIDTEPNEANDYLARFSIGFSAAKKAKELALGVVKPATSAIAGSAQRRSRKPASS